MPTTTEPDLGPDLDLEEPVYIPPKPSLLNSLTVTVLSIVAAFAVPVLVYVALEASFELTADLPKWLGGVAAIIIGVVGAFLLYSVVDFAIRRLPGDMGDRIQPYAWAGPAMVGVALFLMYPAIDTIRLSFMDSTSTEFVGWDNYQYVLTDPSMLRSLRNTVLWIFVVPAVCVAIGLGFAVLADRLKRSESLAKSLIFLPMAISFIGAGIVWRFVYAFRIEGAGEQIGILNAFWTGIGNAPLDWIRFAPWNNIFLMIVMIWLQTGFAMVILSSAIKGVPEEILEAARIDGATEVQAFWQVIVPSIMSSIVVVFTTMVIATLKVFDIVWVMTGGQAGTEVIAERMITNMFRFREFGRGAAVAVFMFLAVIPIMYFNIKRFREEELIR